MNSTQDMVDITDETPIPLSSDHPIYSPSQDLLDRNIYATAIAKSIISWPGDSSLVLAIYGGWGSGKSSLKNLIVSDLLDKKTEAPLVIEFNPWMWSGQDRLLAAFFNEIASAIAGKNNDSVDHAELAQRWRKYGSRLALGGAGLSVLKNTSMMIPVPYLPLIFGSLEKVASKSAELSNLAADAHTDSQEDAPSLGSLRVQLTKSLSKLDKPILVILDDVDRLTCEEMRLLFQLVKLSTNFPNIIFLIMCDRSVVEDALNSVVNDRGRAYLDKIIQVGFDLPKLNTNALDKILFAGLNKIFEKYANPARFSRDRWTETYSSSYRHMFKNVRDVNRFLSSFAFSLSVFTKDGVLEVDPIDCVGIEILRIFEPDTYHRLAMNKDFLTGDRSPLDGPDDPDSHKKYKKSITDTSSSSGSVATTKIINCMFPQMDWLDKGYGQGEGHSGKWARDLRICHPLFFDRYFELNIPPDEIRQSEIEDVLANSGNRQVLLAMFKKLRLGNRLKYMLGRLDDGVYHRIPQDNVLPFVTTMLDIGDEMPKGYQEGLIGLSYDIIARRIIRGTLQKISSQADRDFIFYHALADTSGLVLPVQVVWSDTVSEERERDSTQCLLSDTGLINAQNLCVDKILKTVKQGQLPTHALQLLLAAWRKFDGEDGPKEYVENLISTKQGSLEFIKGISGIVQSSSGTSSSTKEYKVIRLSDIRPYIEVDKLASALHPLLNDSALTDVEYEEYEPYIEAFRNALDRQDNGRPDNPIDDFEATDFSE